MKTKRCCTCRKEKSASEFHKSQGRCKDCVKNENKKPENLKARREAVRRYDEKLKFYEPDERKRRAREYSLKSSYDLSIEEYQKILSAQNGRCAICKDKADCFCVDHCHKTGAVRGILCRKCNLGVGYFRDDYCIISAAAQYIAKFLPALPISVDNHRIRLMNKTAVLHRDFMLRNKK